MSEPTVAVKVDGELLRIFRATLIRKLEPRLRPVIVGGNVTGFEDEAFVRKFGVALDRVPDKMLLTLALVEAADRVDRAPAGKCGYSYFDE
ncbi:MAG: hypothetical protein F4Y50_12555 [Dehalococcoidia bacterium]|nr:hypothetical protein [Dehalococcoidia bacterium]